MWVVRDNTIQMAEGDFGIGLPVTVNGATLEAGDSLRFTFKQQGYELLTKEFGDIVDNTVEIVFTQEESELFAPGVYSYTLDWFKDGEFMCNIVLSGVFKVVDKA